MLFFTAVFRNIRVKETSDSFQLTQTMSNAKDKQIRLVSKFALLQCNVTSDVLPNCLSYC